MDQLLITKERVSQPLEPYKAEELVPFEFKERWEEKNIVRLPARSNYRRILAMDLIDGFHWKTCGSNRFHTQPNENCWCTICGCSTPKLYHKCCNFDSIT